MCVRGEQHGVWVHYPGRLHKRPGLHIAFMMQRRPALAGNNGSTVLLLSLSLSLSLFRLLSSTPSAPPRLLQYFFHCFPSLSLSLSGNRLVKVITLITHLRTKYTFSHLFFFFFLWGAEELVSSSSPRSLIFRIVAERIRVESSCYLYVASGACVK